MARSAGLTSVGQEDTRNQFCGVVPETRTRVESPNTDGSRRTSLTRTPTKGQGKKLSRQSVVALHACLTSNSHTAKKRVPFEDGRVNSGSHGSGATHGAFRPSGLRCVRQVAPDPAGGAALQADSTSRSVNGSGARREPQNEPSQSSGEARRQGLPALRRWLGNFCASGTSKDVKSRQQKRVKPMYTVFDCDAAVRERLFIEAGLMPQDQAIYGYHARR